MEDIFILLYLSLTLGLLWSVLKGKKKKKRKPLERIEELVLKQAEELDERNKILIELYAELYKKKDWIPNPKNKNS